MARATCVALALCALLAGRLATAAPMYGCDFNGDGSCDVADLDDLGYTGLGSHDLAFDIDGNGVVADSNFKLLSAWVRVRELW